MFCQIQNIVADLHVATCINQFVLAIGLILNITYVPTNMLSLIILLIVICCVFDKTLRTCLPHFDASPLSIGRQQRCSWICLKAFDYTLPFTYWHKHLKTPKILRLLIAKPSIYFVSMFCLFILFESFIWLILWLSIEVYCICIFWIIMEIKLSNSIIQLLRHLCFHVLTMRYHDVVNVHNCFWGSKVCRKSIHPVKLPYLCQDHGLCSCYTILSFFNP